MLHDLQADGLQGGQAQKELRKTLGGYGVHGLGACLQALQDLLLEDLNLLLRSGAQSLGIWTDKRQGGK